MEATSSTPEVSSVSSTQQSSQAKPKAPSFVFPEYAPHMEAKADLRFDFNYGARIVVPPTGSYRVRILDKMSGNVLRDGPVAAGYVVTCNKKFFMDYRLDAWDLEKNEHVWSHDFDAEGKDVLIQLPIKGALGDTIAWFSAVERFQLHHKCILHVMMPEELTKLFSPQYPDIKFETSETARQLRPYATYYLGLFFKGDTDWQPYDFRLCSLSETAGRILGNDDLSEIPPRLSIGDTSIPADPYVCIATQASNHAKHWNCPGGWRRVIKVLTSSGYRVLCIDKDAESGHGDVWHEIPHGCEDFTGNRLLQERADLIRHAKCFIGLSSGLSWLAWSCGTPIVLISGICMPFGEFQTPYRVQTRHTCHGCWNDTRYEFDHSDYMWCPVLKGTDRAFECTRAISPAMVLDAISKVPGMELKTRQV